MDTHEMRAAETATRPREHLVQFYEAESFLLDTVAEFIGPALADAGVGVVIASRDHLERIDERLTASGIDPDVAAARGDYVTFDAAEALQQISVSAVPDAGRFRGVVGDRVARLTAGGRPVHVFGEMVALLAGDGNHTGALQLEALWNELQREHDFALLCSYPIGRCGGNGALTWLGDVCHAHSHVIPAESYSALSSEAARLHSVVTLQQKALQLEAAIAERHAIEERLVAALAAEQSARREALATQTRHDALLADTAHDLRNPLTSLSLNAQLTLRHLERGERVDPRRVERAMRAIADQAARMSELLDRLLDVPGIDPAPRPCQDERDA